MSDEKKSRIAAGNTRRCFYSLRQIFRRRAMSKAVKRKIYKPVAVYGSETWVQWIWTDWVGT